VNKWRAENLMKDNLDFVYVYVDVERAYSQAEQAVAVAWGKARVLVEPEMVTEMAKISAVKLPPPRFAGLTSTRKHLAARRIWLSYPS